MSTVTKQKQINNLKIKFNKKSEKWEVTVFNSFLLKEFNTMDEAINYASNMTGFTSRVRKVKSKEMEKQKYKLQWEQVYPFYAFCEIIKNDIKQGTIFINTPTKEEKEWAAHIILNFSPYIQEYILGDSINVFEELKQKIKNKIDFEIPILPQEYIKTLNNYTKEIA